MRRSAMRRLLQERDNESVLCRLACSAKSINGAAFETNVLLLPCKTL